MYVCIDGTISTYAYCTHTPAQDFKSTNIRALIMFKKTQSNKKLSKEEKKRKTTLYVRLGTFNCLHLIQQLCKVLPFSFL